MTSHVIKINWITNPKNARLLFFQVVTNLKMMWRDNIFPIRKLQYKQEV